MATVLVMDPHQFVHMSPVQIKEVSNESAIKQLKEIAAQPSVESLPAQEVSNDDSKQTNNNEEENKTGIERDSNEKPTSKPQVVVIPIGEKGNMIDLEGNNAKSSFHLSIVISFMFAMLCMTPLAFIPFAIVHLRFRSNPTESSQVYTFSERSRLIAIGILFFDFILLMIVSVIVLIVLFSLGII